MTEKQTHAAIYLILRQVEQYIDKKGCLPSAYLKKYDLLQKGFIRQNEFILMLEPMLDPKQYRYIMDVWYFLLDKKQNKDFLNGEMLDQTIAKLRLIDSQFQQISPQLPQNQSIQGNQQGNLIQQAYNQQKQLQNQQNQQKQQQTQQQQQNLNPHQQQQQNNKNFLQQFQQPNITPFHQPDNNYKQQQKPFKLLQQPSRSVEQIFKILTKTINKNQSTLKEMFNMFDQDGDSSLNINELRGFFFNQIPFLTESEFQTMVFNLNGGNNNSSSVMVSLFKLMKKTQDGNAMMNSIKNDNFQPIVNQKAKKAPEVYTNQLARISIGQNLLESNIYENQSNPDFLTSKIDFQEYFVIDHNTPGLQNFIDRFVQSKKRGQLFVDPNFPADQNSLGGKLNSKVQAWMRPKDIWKNKNFNFFVKDEDNTRVGLGKWISPSDISQGELGDCYFLASVSSIACRRPDIILDLFVTRKVNPCGMYCVRINIDGQWTAVYVDDIFPTKYGQPVFTQSKSREIWVMVLEKAWAKIFGSYLNIESGVAREVMRALTGAPTKNLDTSDKEFLHDLEKCCQEKYIMVSGSHAIDEQQGITRSVIANTGLVPGHAYSILKIKLITHPKLGKVKLVKLRNPWASKEWQGDWSDKSSLWTPEIRKQLGYVGSNEGVFYMDISSFIQHFSDIQVCLMRPNYKYRSEQIVSTKKNSIYFAVKIEEAGEYFFTVIQRNKRFKDGQAYSPARIVIGEKFSNGHYKLSASCNKHADREIWCTGQFKVGVYIVQIKVNWQHTNENTFIFSSYGQGRVGINQVKKIPDFIRAMYYDMAKSCKTKKHYDGEPKIEKCYEFPIDTGHGYFYVENQSKKIIESTVNFQESSGIKLCKPDRGKILKITLGPGKNHLSIFTISPKGYSYSFQESLIIRQV